MSAAERCGCGLASRSRTCRTSTSPPEKQLATIRTACSACRDFSTANSTFTGYQYFWLLGRKTVRGRLGRYRVGEAGLAHHDDILRPGETRRDLHPDAVINIGLDGDLSSNALLNHEHCLG